MTDTDIAYYGSYVEQLLSKEKWLVSHLEEILARVSTDAETRPAEHILSRIKSADSLQKKMMKKGVDADVNKAMKTLSDIIGVRIVVHFVGDVYEILKQIELQDIWRVVAVKDYISSPKPNGYRSLHVILNVPFSGEDFDSMNVEIQIRTIAMDCWASLEHQLKYKKEINNSQLIINELGRCAAEMASVDLTLETIREMIQKG